jgi:Disulphide bond corrector protein DsbC
MKKLIVTSFFSAIITILSAQNINPIQWSYTSKKIADKTYEVQLTATIQNTWHLYAQKQPANAIAEPVQISFNKNPLIAFDGPIKEIGKLEFINDEKLKISANQYSNKVTFVQKIKLKANVKTNVVGTVLYQTCDDKKCLPPKKIDFTIAVK